MLMKCNGYYLYLLYCSKEYQTKIWVDGQHVGECRYLRILQKYVKLFAKNIRKDIEVHGINCSQSSQFCQDRKPSIKNCWMKHKRCVLIWFNQSFPTRMVRYKLNASHVQFKRHVYTYRSILRILASGVYGLTYSLQWGPQTIIYT